MTRRAHDSGTYEAPSAVYCGESADYCSALRPPVPPAYHDGRHRSYVTPPEPLTVRHDRHGRRSTALYHPIDRYLPGNRTDVDGGGDARDGTVWKKAATAE